MTRRRRTLALRVAAILTAAVALIAGPAAATSTTAGAGKSSAVRTTSTTASTTSTTTSTTATTTTHPAPATITKPPAAVAPPKPAKVARAKQPQPLTGSLGNSASFPMRTLLLSVPTPGRLSANRLHVTENGRPVSGATVTPLTQANAGDFGVVVVIDQSLRMSGASLASALAGVRALAAQRTGNQELGLITFDATPSLMLPLTSDPKSIQRALAAAPWVAPGAHALPALALALQQLDQAHVAAGAVIVVSDAADSQAVGSATAESVSDPAGATGVRIVMVGLRDGSYSPRSISQLANAAGGQALQATGPHLPKVLAGVWSDLTHSYLVRYRSAAGGGRRVNVSARADGVPGKVSTYYNSPAAAVTPRRHVALPVKRPAKPAPAPLPATLPTVPTRPQTFWSSSSAVLAVSGACAVLIGLAIAILLWRRPTKRAVLARVGSFIPVFEELDLEGLGQATGTRSGWQALLARRRWWPKFVEDVEIARIQRTPVQLVKYAAGASVVAALLLTVGIGSPFVGALALLPGLMILRAFVRRAVRRQRARFADQLPSHLQDLSGAMRAGRSFVGAISAVAETADEPMKGELERALADERLGRPLEETLEGIARRMRADDVDQVALIAALHRRSGSNVAEALDRVAEGSRERSDLRRELSALTAQARISGWVLSGLPPMFLLAISLLDPSYAQPMFHTIGGIVTLCVCAAMVISGWFVMKKITNVEA